MNDSFDIDKELIVMRDQAADLRQFASTAEGGESADTLIEAAETIEQLLWVTAAIRTLQKQWRETASLINSDMPNSPTAYERSACAKDLDLVIARVWEKECS